MKSRNVSRRSFVKGAAIGGLGLAASTIFPKAVFSTPHIRSNKIARKMIVLGIDGMDPVILNRFIASGELPTFKRLIDQGHYGNLQTTLPPQSPVAWASFITGSNPGKHGIYDFIHRDAENFVPYLSTSKTIPAEKTVEIGGWIIPIRGGRVELKRRGVPFWRYLEEHSVPATLSQLPANFPVESGKSRQLSGMGTPDVLGSYGTYTFYGETEPKGAREWTGGRFVKVVPKSNVFSTRLEGPPNSFKTKSAAVGIDFTIYRDPNNSVIKIALQNEEVILNQGEWSGWIPVSFKLVPLLANFSGIVRFYVQQVHPELRLYVSPINIDPSDPALPICSPPDYSEELARQLGPYYTQGFPEDTKALSQGVFSDDEFFQQSKLVIEERRAALEYELNNQKEGLLFFYFSTIDQASHMMMRTLDPEHPLHPIDASVDVKEAMLYYYRQMDDALKQTLGYVDNYTPLMVMSDHGFAPFTREFQLSTWLVENGFTAMSNPSRMHQAQFYQGVDWGGTKAYALGINGIYLNLRGRERHGSVSVAEGERVKRDLITKLEAVKDPKTGQNVILKVYESQKAYSGPYLSIAPDLIVAYQSGYRCSDESVLGKFPRGTVTDRQDKWSADHCMDPSLVPGILLANRTVTSKKAGIWDLAPTILQQFGIKPPADMDGKVIV